ncbi:hypothetical protein [Actinoplanes utahensis]|uniref:Uncharacterized protein n=1 Tax=Actinoplanes utahensis TaxID=1869 RepID=A0A0A6UCN8_ACTUT|nr:hypothetical protein [Actinoplanes utahensis]KHD73251.1 hypothetical protein MB27_35435 [Actinoplanes utahensis]GIF27476.1 hypothetical protein Aut01nite_04620 [Actinoplanes utahensis]
MSGDVDATPPVYLEAPRPWVHGRRPYLRLAAALVLAAFALLVLVALPRLILDGDAVATAVAVLTASLSGHLAGLFAFAGWRPRRRHVAPVAGTGLTFRYSRWAYYWPIGVKATLLAAFVLLCVLTRDPVGVGLLAVVASPVLIRSALFHLRMLRHGFGSLTLSPAGIHHHGAGFQHFVPWRAVIEVRPGRIAGHPALVIHNIPTDATRVRRQRFRRLGTLEEALLPSMTVRGSLPAADPEQVYLAVRHYFVNPGHRTELSSPAAVTRVRQGRFLIR